MIVDFNLIAKSVYDTTHNLYIHAFLILVMVDIASGTLKAFKQKVGNSSKGLWGLMKHLLVVCVVIFADIYLPLLGFASIATSFLVFFIVQYMISITENWGQLGLPLPEQIRSILCKLNSTSEKEFKELDNVFCDKNKEDKK